MRRGLIAGGVLAAAALLGAASDAQAQDNPPATRGGDLALGRFNPAPAGDRMFGVPSPFVAGDPALHVMLLGDYAHAPLVLVREEGEEDVPVGDVVNHQFFLHLNANLALWHRLAINVNIPVAIYQSGDEDLPGNLVGASDPAFGDVRLGARLRLVGDYFDPFQLGVGGYVWLPSGDDTNYTSDGTVRGMPYASIGGRGGRVVWTVATGPEFRDSKSFANVNQGDMYYFGGGLGFLLGEEKQFQIGPELNMYLNFEEVTQRTTNGEIMLDMRYRIGDFEMGAGVGPGITTGVGTPDVRAVFMVAYTPEMKEHTDRDGDGIFDDVDACPDVPGVADPDPAKHGCPPPSDRDKDGILDPVDACPDVPGVADPDPKKNGCPPPNDRDKDGILDGVDACPDEPGVASEDPAKNGCPPDRDGDTVYDKDDACPDIPGIKTNDPATNGCPGDTDGDGIRDDKDACPREKGVADPDPTKNGCPKLVRFTDTEIIILQQVQFDTGKATIRKESDELLNEVASVLKDHPEIVKMEVQGHTDNRGSKALNAKLSDDRAKAVAAALVSRGIDTSRLTGKGYGFDKPIGDNKTDEGRQKNRRVQFIVTEKKAVATVIPVPPPGGGAAPATPAPGGATPHGGGGH